MLRTALRYSVSDRHDKTDQGNGVTVATTVFDLTRICASLYVNGQGLSVNRGFILHIFNQRNPSLSLCGEAVPVGPEEYWLIL